MSDVELEYGSVSFLASELGRWDQLWSSGQRYEALALPFFSDERPLRGAAGLCDFRLCGRISRLLKSNRIAGELGEVTLYPPGPRLPFERLLLFGLGSQAMFDEAIARRGARNVLKVVEQLGLKRYAIVSPGRSTGCLPAKQALSLFLAEIDAQHCNHDLVVVEPSVGQKEAAVLARAGKR
jgi:hypothetical protein